MTEVREQRSAVSQGEDLAQRVARLEAAGELLFKHCEKLQLRIVEREEAVKQLTAALAAKQRLIDSLRDRLRMQSEDLRWSARASPGRSLSSDR